MVGGPIADHVPTFELRVMAFLQGTERMLQTEALALVNPGQGSGHQGCDEQYALALARLSMTRSNFGKTQKGQPGSLTNPPPVCYTERSKKRGRRLLPGPFAAEPAVCASSSQ
jgi:hypothetical protein